MKLSNRGKQRFGSRTSCRSPALAFPVVTYLEDKHFPPMCSLAVRRDVIDAVGPFDERLVSGGDKEFGRRVHRAGFAQEFTDETRAYHPARTTWRALRKKALRIDRGRAQARRYAPGLVDTHPLHPIHLIPPSPFRLRRRFAGDDVSLPTLAGLYGLEYVLKLFQAWGDVRATLAQWRT